MDIRIDCAHDLGEFRHFWQSTGFSPAELLLADDMKQTLAYVGSVPHGGVTHVRIHYLLDLVTAEGLDTDQPVYDWSRLDAGLDVLVENGLKPFFELMGNPSGYFKDYEDDAQLYAWRRLVRDLARRYSERYGQEEVRSWYFETWNEPDLPFWKHSEEGFCNYYDACSEGLKEADEGLRFGGPGTAITLSSTFKTLLAHCDSGTNYFTGERGVRLDFISVHEKGVKPSKEDLTPHSEAISEREAGAVAYIRRHHPRFADLPFMNNECDPQVGWEDIHTWRARPYYPALIVKIINQHLLKLVEGAAVNYALLGNDNGFMGTWGQRTHLTRFGGKELPRGQAEHRTDLGRLGDAKGQAFELVKKPALDVMVLLSLLGDRRCAVRGAGDASAEVGLIATTRGEDQIGVVVYNSRDRIMSSGTVRIVVTLAGVPFEKGMLAHYRIDEAHGDPFAIWEVLGAPDMPMAEEYEAMRRHAELTLLEEPREVATSAGSLALELEMPLPSVSLILLSRRPERGPGRPEAVRAERYRGLTGHDNIMLSWKGVGSRTVRTYEILYATSPEGPFTRVNAVDTLCTAFLHARARQGEGYYKVWAVDYWGRPGKASETVTL